MDDLDAYCPMCGTVSYIVKQNSNGKIFIPLDKIIPYGTLLITCGILLNVIGFIIFQKIIPIFFGLGLAIAVVGIVIVAKYKKTVEFGRNYAANHKYNDEGEKCRFCKNTLYKYSKYCPLCGSKINH
ncbi:MAG TPA: hypothetical protein PK629_03475 [Oscillospiraceae bacterium]|nr:hypothetical protein [Oscillospiraceae bacterium]HPF55655.1 hypothetical protein [Clostridiales bacterium]HPK34727.1 hypothetical protein [Oscillospiraceae bacterium]HPR76059.1 hypothetical protein [Oscillospiraceae bacterium]